ncbi:type I restriction endonuclease subunit R [Candidatus Pelagibacter sp.]|nr:type I restriction endonuclease subunit R [Candidatus Pelagibacter sp.]
MRSDYNEDNLVEQAAVDVLKDLGWKIETAWHKEIFENNQSLGRENKSEIILKKFFIPSLEKLNPDLPKFVYEEVFLKIREIETNKKLNKINKDKYELFKSGVTINYLNENGEQISKNLKIFDFENPNKNHFLAVRQFEVQGELYLRRPDIIGFVNGIPLIFFELKSTHQNLRNAYDDNLKDYKDTISHLFNPNAFIILSNGLQSKIGTITSTFNFFHEWKRISEKDESDIQLETMIKGTCSKDRFFDLFENFLAFEESNGEIIKILAKNHQFLGVNNIIKNVKSIEDLKGKLGVFWHTQGSGKSYSMFFLSEKIHRKFFGSYTIVIVLDREELETQLYKTFTAVGAVKDKKLLAESREHLRELLKENHKYVFTLIHKFSINKGEKEYPLLSERKDIIVISDEAHRTQGGVYARNMRFNALPNASYIGFTGTPIIKGEEEITKNIFGDYISIYDFKSSIEDGATLPLTYSNRGDKLKIDNPEIDEQLLEIIDNEDLNEDQRVKVQRALKSNYPIMTSEKRLRSVAKDIVWHFNERKYQGKAMLVTIDKPTAVKMYNYIKEFWEKYLIELNDKIKNTKDDNLKLGLKKKYKKIFDTEICVIVSNEQNEVDKFKKLNLDIATHRRKIVERELDDEFKNNDNPFRLAIVCAMWITGFDAPGVSTIYLDKPIKGHTLMQTIARANRVYDDEKVLGLIVDYGNVYRQLEEAYSFYGEGGNNSNGISGGDNKPTRDIDKLVIELRDSIKDVKQHLSDQGFILDNLYNAGPVQKLKLLQDSINSVCLNDRTRAEFDVKAKLVINKFNALYPEEEIKQFNKDFAAIEAIFKSLNQEKKEINITEILKKLQDHVSDYIQIKEDSNKEEVKIDLSKLNFERLKELFKKKTINKSVYDLKEAIDKKLKMMIQKNPQRTDFYKKYLGIIKEYNEGKDAEAVRKAFEDLIKFVNDLDEEENRAIRENLDEETLAIYDLLKKDNLKKNEEKTVKDVAIKTLKKLKEEKLKIDRWRESQQITAQIKTIIRECLLHLPEEIYPDNEIEFKTMKVYQHIYSCYYGSGKSIYTNI